MKNSMGKLNSRMEMTEGKIDENFLNLQKTHQPTCPKPWTDTNQDKSKEILSKYNIDKLLQKKKKIEKSWR